MGKDFEASRLVNISRNGALLENLGVNQQAKMIRDESKVAEPAKKKRRVEKSNWKPAPSRVSATGRWRRMLLKKYVSAGVRDVFDDGEEEEQVEVSPVMHQTCHHWAFCVTQEVLDEYWKTGK